MKMESKPILFDKKEECCGCSACYCICPTNSIIMEADEEGFLYPIINYDTCVNCKMCIKVCPFKQTPVSVDL